MVRLCQAGLQRSASARPCRLADTARSMSPPRSCSTFGEVLTAYEHYAMGAASRRSQMYFAPETRVPDNLRSIAQDSMCRSPRSQRRFLPVSTSASSLPASSQPMSKQASGSSRGSLRFQRVASDRPLPFDGSCHADVSNSVPTKLTLNLCECGSSSSIGRERYSSRVSSPRNVHERSFLRTRSEDYPHARSCTTFGEVLWAYESRASDAARRKTQMSFASDSHIPDNLCPIAHKAGRLFLEEHCATSDKAKPMMCLDSSKCLTPKQQLRCRSIPTTPRSSTPRSNASDRRRYGGSYDFGAIVAAKSAITNNKCMPEGWEDYLELITGLSRTPSTASGTSEKKH